MDVPSTSATPRSEKRSRSDRSARNLAHDEDSSDSPRRGPNPFISNPLAHPQFQPQRLGARGVSQRPISINLLLNYRSSFKNNHFLGYKTAKSPESAREAADAVHALQPQGVGLGEGTAGQRQAVGGWTRHRSDVARLA